MSARRRSVICAWLSIAALTSGGAASMAEDENNDAWRLMPVNKIFATEAVASSVNFGQIKVGARLPGLTLAYRDGARKVELNSLIKRRRTVLLFFKSEACMHCSWQMSELRGIMGDLDAMGFQVIAVRHRTWPNPRAVRPEGLTEPQVLVLCDTKRIAGKALRIYAADDSQEIRYYTENAFGSYGPALYVVSTDGVIEYEWYHRYDHVRLSGRTILAIAKHVSDPANIIPTDLAAALADPEAATRLNLSYQGLTELPPGVCAMVNLQDLRLNGNKLEALPPEIGDLVNLRNLELDDNALTELPPEIGRLRKLENLQLLRNGLSRLPAEIGGLAALKRLNLMYNPVAELPPEIGQLGQLQMLRLCKHRLKELPDEIGELTNLQHLFLPGEKGEDGTNAGIETLTPAVGKLGNLIELNLVFNRLKRLPPEIGGLKRLEMLHVAENDLEALPPEIGDLERLGGGKAQPTKRVKGPDRALMDKFDLSGNRLKTLPPEIGRLRFRDHAMLILDRNEFTELPPELADMQLKALSIQDNKLTSLPEELSNMNPYAWFLSLRGNGFTELPAWIFEKHGLAVLDVADNELTELPLGLLKLTKLQRADFSGNRITSIPDGIVGLQKGNITLKGNPIPAAERARFRQLCKDEGADPKRFRF